MRILFDHGTPEPLIPFLPDHSISTAKRMGRDTLSNGQLLKSAEDAGFELLLKTDKNMAAQQNMKGRAIAIVVLGNSQWRLVQRHVRRIAAAVSGAQPGTVTRIDIPF